MTTLRNSFEGITSGTNVTAASQTGGTSGNQFDLVTVTGTAVICDSVTWTMPVVVPALPSIRVAVGAIDTLGDTSSSRIVPVAWCVGIMIVAFTGADSVRTTVSSSSTERGSVSAESRSFGPWRSNSRPIGRLALSAASRTSRARRRRSS